MQMFAVNHKLTQLKHLKKYKYRNFGYDKCLLLKQHVSDSLFMLSLLNTWTFGIYFS